MPAVPNKKAQQETGKSKGRNQRRVPRALTSALSPIKRQGPPQGSQVIASKLKKRKPAVRCVKDAGQSLGEVGWSTLRDSTNWLHEHPRLLNDTVRTQAQRPPRGQKKMPPNHVVRTLEHHELRQKRRTCNGV